MTDMGEITIRVPAEMVNRWRKRGISDFEAYLRGLAREADEQQLPPITLLSAWRKPTKEEIAETIAAIREAAAEFREGLNEEELAEIVRDMNAAEHIEPKDPDLFAWLDEVPEGER